MGAALCLRLATYLRAHPSRDTTQDVVLCSETDIVKSVNGGVVHDCLTGCAGRWEGIAVHSEQHWSSTHGWPSKSQELWREKLKAQFVANNEPCHNVNERIEHMHCRDRSH
jgi:hypothetical protein